LKSGKISLADSKPKEKIFNSAQIIIYGILGLNEKAVEFSLQTLNIEYAKKYANKAIDPKLRKNLLLKIAKKILGVDDWGQKSMGDQAQETPKSKVEEVLKLIHEQKDQQYEDEEE